MRPVQPHRKKHEKSFTRSKRIEIVMQEDSLNYRSSGVDVEAYNRASAQIKAHIQDTFGSQILTRAGLFGAAISLKEYGEKLNRPLLSGSLGVGNSIVDDELADQIVHSCRANLPPSAQPIAFLDYIAAAQLDLTRAVGLVGSFSRILSRDPKIPMVGGETAEMPGVFPENCWEVVGAMFAVQEASALQHVPAAVDLEAEAGAALSHPALVFSMDGVGTKTKVGVMTRRTAGLALDIIHHSLNDILCQGARGIGLMLYIGCHERDEQLIRPLLAAAEKCCRSNGLVLLDRVVAKRAELYLSGEIDLCAAIAGSVDADHLIQGDTIRRGDRIIGLTSSGLHTNGYSLARKALLERGGLRLDQHIGELGCSLGEALLEPHRNYAPVVLSLLDDAELAPAIKGIAHITGGGLKDNLGRILPRKLGADIQLNSWQPPPIYDLIRRKGNIPLEDPVGKGMYESFNMGIGLVLIVAPKYNDRILEMIQDGGCQALVIGRVVDRPVASQGQRPAEPSGRVRLL